LDDHSTLAFHAESGQVQAFPQMDLPDEFFNHTVADVKYMFEELRNQR
jgi:hypothetical protein